MIREASVRALRNGQVGARETNSSSSEVEVVW